jgi:hypothetical protein
MTNTVLVEASDDLPAQRALGYKYDAGRYVGDDVDHYTPGPGGVYSTVMDLAKFSAAVEARKLFRSDTWALALAEGRTSDGKPTPFGLGWQVEGWGRGPLAGLSYFGAFGDLNGFRAMYMQIPSRSVTIIALSNSGLHPLELELPELYLAPKP